MNFNIGDIVSVNHPTSSWHGFSGVVVNSDDLNIGVYRENHLVRVLFADENRTVPFQASSLILTNAIGLNIGDRVIVIEGPATVSYVGATGVIVGCSRYSYSDESFTVKLDDHGSPPIGFYRSTLKRIETKVPQSQYQKCDFCAQTFTSNQRARGAYECCDCAEKRNRRSNRY